METSEFHAFFEKVSKLIGQQVIYKKTGEVCTLTKITMHYPDNGWKDKSPKLSLRCQIEGTNFSSYRAKRSVSYKQIDLADNTILQDLFGEV